MVTQGSIPRLHNKGVSNFVSFNECRLKEKDMHFLLPAHERCGLNRFISTSTVQLPRHGKKMVNFLESEAMHMETKYN